MYLAECFYLSKFKGQSHFFGKVYGPKSEPGDGKVYSPKFKDAHESYGPDSRDRVRSVTCSIQSRHQIYL